MEGLTTGAEGTSSSFALYVIAYMSEPKSVDNSGSVTFIGDGWGVVLMPRSLRGAVGLLIYKSNAIFCTRRWASAMESVCQGQGWSHRRRATPPRLLVVSFVTFTVLFQRLLIVPSEEIGVSTTWPCRSLCSSPMRVFALVCLLFIKGKHFSKVLPAISHPMRARSPHVIDGAC